MVKVLKEIKRLGEKSVLTDKLDTILSRVSGLHEVVYESETLEGEVAKWHEGFARDNAEISLSPQSKRHVLFRPTKPPSSSRQARPQRQLRHNVFLKKS